MLGTQRNGRQVMPAAALSLGFLEVFQFCLTRKLILRSGKAANHLTA
jgi:hypothetical protein